MKSEKKLHGFSYNRGPKRSNDRWSYSSIFFKPGQEAHLAMMGFKFAKWIIHEYVHFTKHLNFLHFDFLFVLIKEEQPQRNSFLDFTQPFVAFVTRKLSTVRKRKRFSQDTVVVSIYWYKKNVQKNQQLILMKI